MTATWARVEEVGMVLECFGRVLPGGKSGLERFQGAGVAGELVRRHQQPPSS
jgi:hypothetical protein